MTDWLSDAAPRFKDITRKSGDEPPPWDEAKDHKQPPWAPQKIHPHPKSEMEDDLLPEHEDDLPNRRVPMQRRTSEFPREGVEAAPSAAPERETRSEGSWWISRLRRWVCARKRRERKTLPALPEAPEMDEEEKRVRRITPSCYNAMEIHGFFGLVDDGPCSSGRMLIVHQPSWVRGQFLDIKDGDEIHVWHVAGKSGGVLRVLSTGRHRYYSPGQRVTTCTVCVPEEQWERLMQ
jgi:hypothetical protein